MDKKMVSSLKNKQNKQKLQHKSSNLEPNLNLNLNKDPDEHDENKDLDDSNYEEKFKNLVGYKYGLAVLLDRNSVSEIESKDEYLKWETLVGSGKAIIIDYVRGVYYSEAIPVCKKIS